MEITNTAKAFDRLKPFLLKGLGYFPTSKLFCRRCSRGQTGKKYRKDTPFLCLLRNFLYFLRRYKSTFYQTDAKKTLLSAKITTLSKNLFNFHRRCYSPSCSIPAASFAMAVTLYIPISLILLSRASSCRRPVDFAAGSFENKNWSTDIWITGYKVIEYLQARLLSFVLDIRKISRRYIARRLPFFGSHYEHFSLLLSQP